jgi:hypothetical protein
MGFEPTTPTLARLCSAIPAQVSLDGVFRLLPAWEVDLPWRRPHSRG